MDAIDSVPKSLLARLLRAIVVVFLVLMPLHAFLTVWLMSIVGHDTLVLRVWKVALLAIAFSLLLVIVAKYRQIFTPCLRMPAVKYMLILFGGYIGLHVMVAAWHILVQRSVSNEALSYALISNLRFILFFTISFAVGYMYRSWLLRYWKRLLLWPAGLVVSLGLLQFLVLPADFLKHFGYGQGTLQPYVAVDEKPEYARVQSTTRGPNPLGAYLLVILCALTASFLHKRQVQVVLYIFAGLLVMFGTYSRSAWLGLLLSLAVLLWVGLKSRHKRTLCVLAGICIVVVSVCIIVFRNNDMVQNVVFHTDEKSQSETSSNEDRMGAMKRGLADLRSSPLGDGPGSAGPTSIYNGDEGTRIAESYFIQIGQEVGVIGLAIFICITVLVGKMLWGIRKHGTLPLALFASFVGLTFVNLLSHAWADDTLAYIWWGFAGLAIGSFAMSETKKEGKPRAKKTV